MFKLDDYFKEAIKQGASDLHLAGGQLPTLRIDGKLFSINKKPLDNKLLELEIFKLIGKNKENKVKEEKEYDFAHQVNGIRFRINLHFQLGNIGLVARIIPAEIPTPDDLRFNSTINDFTNLYDGLVLVTGPTGCGKSTTLATMIEEINKKRKSHIITIEDPIEFLFNSKLSLIKQREIGNDTNSFANALKHILRQDPNVIFVGEMRDPETIAAVLTAAETGHLVFSTLHTPSAAESVERIIDVFDGAKQRQILIQLSSVLRGVVSQHLIPAKNGGRVPVREIMVNTPAVANLIRENNVSQIKTAIQTGVKDGMVTLENSLKELLEQDLIEEEVVKKMTGRSKKV